MARALRAASEPTGNILGTPATRSPHSLLLHPLLRVFCDPLLQAVDSAATFINQCQGNEQGINLMALVGSGRGEPLGGIQTVWQWLSAGATSHAQAGKGNGGGGGPCCPLTSDSCRNQKCLIVCSKCVVFLTNFLSYAN